MCGIAGIVDSSDSTSREERVRRMVERIRHRGPDASDLRTDGPVTFGHARLKVIDLETGAQPMSRDDLGASIVFNGEVYNYVELRGQLVSKGHQFRTTSDTEVLLVAYREWGRRCVERLRGMFAFVIHDQRSGELFAARDRFGKKPLLYWTDGRRFAFASELKALLELDFVSRELDPVAVAAYFQQGWVPERRCIFRSVEKLAPGSTLTWQNGTVRIEPYWAPVFAERPIENLTDVVDELERVFGEAVKIRLRSDVPFGVFLSGGVDSALTAAAAARVLDRPLKVFTVRMRGTQDEVPFASIIARAIGAEHTVIPIDEPSPERICADLARFDEPFFDSSAVPVSLISEAAKQHVTVVLSGDGGDELFGGYDCYTAFGDTNASPPPPLRASPTARRIKALLPPIAARAARRLVALAPTHRFGLRRGSRQDPLRTHMAFRQQHYEPSLDELLRTDIRAAVDRGLAEQVQAVTTVAPALNRVFEYDFRHYLVGDILKKVDMATMAWGLECRSPLLDSEVAALSLRTAWPVKVWRRETKRPLKALLQRWLGSAADSVINRDKTGFGAPVEHWLADDRMRGVLRDMLEGGSLRSSDVVDPRAARTLLRRFLTGRQYLAQPLWTLFAFELWSRAYR